MRHPGREPELGGHQVDAERLFGHRVLHLDPCIDLEEDHGGGVAGRGGVDEELHRPGSSVAQVLAEPASAVVEELTAWPWSEARRRALLDELLVAALDRAVPVADHDAAALAVAEDLHLDVPGGREEPLQVEGGVTEPGAGLGLRLVDQGGERVLGVDQVDTAASASVDRLEQDREADLAGRLVRLLRGP